MKGGEFIRNRGGADSDADRGRLPFFQHEFRNVAPFKVHALHGSCRNASMTTPSAEDCSRRFG